MRKCLLAIAFLLLLAVQSQACNPEPGPQHFPVITELSPPPRIVSGYFRVYNSLNGLPHNEIKSILLFAADDKNYVIVGTIGHGLMIFDDEIWHTASKDGLFNFPETTVTALVKINSTSFYAGTPAGIFKARYSGGRFTFEQVATGHHEVLNVNAISQHPDEPEKFLIACDRVAGTLIDTSFTAFSMPEHLDPSGFSAIIVSDLGSFAGCNGGLFEISGNGLLPPSGTVKEIGWVNSLVKAGDRLFIASSNGVTQLMEEDKLESVLPGAWSTCLAFSAMPQEALSGKDFKAFENTGGSREMLQEDDPFESLRQQHATLQRDYAEYTRRFADQPIADPGAVDQMYQRFFDFYAAMDAINSGLRGKEVKVPLLRGLWIGTQDAGLVLFATNGRRYHLAADNSKLPADHVTAIACAEDGETWVGTSGGGLMRYHSRQIGGKGEVRNLLTCQPTRIRVLGDMLAIGTEDDGMHLYDIKSLSSYGHFTHSTIEGFHQKVTDFIFDQDGRLWVTGDKGVFVLSGKHWQQIKMVDDKNRKVDQTKTATNIIIDSQKRIFVAFADDDRVYNQVHFFDGNLLVRTDPAAVQRILEATGSAQLESIKTHALNGVYMRNFNFASAAASLAAFETGDSSRVTALLNTEHYLLVGLENGMQKMFDGESYKQLSKQGTGHIGAIANLFRLPGGVIVVQGSEGINEFDGQQYKLIVSPATGPGFKITDMCLDQLNPETYRISFSSSQGGGYSRYQESFWEKFYTTFPVISMAQADRIIFLASPEGVSYVIE